MHLFDLVEVFAPMLRSGGVDVKARALVDREQLVGERRDARVGQNLTIAGRCVDAFERKGHQYIVNDVEILDAAGSSIAAIRHTAIYQVAKSHLNRGKS